MMQWFKKFSCGSGSYGATLLRLWLSALLCYQGFQHFHELTGLFHTKWISLSGLILVCEIAGSLLLFFGLFVRLGCLFAWVVAFESLYSHGGSPSFWGNGNFETALIFFVVTLVVMIEGAGECSVDQLIKK